MYESENHEIYVYDKGDVILSHKLDGTVVISLSDPEKAKQIELPSVLETLIVCSIDVLKNIKIPNQYIGEVMLALYESEIHSFSLPETFNMDRMGVRLPNVESVDELKFPKYVSWVNLPKLKKAGKIEITCPSDNHIYLDELEEVEELKLPENFDGVLSLSGLKSANGLVLPENFDGMLRLDSLERIDGLIIFESSYESVISGLEKGAENARFNDNPKAAKNMEKLIFNLRRNQLRNDKSKEISMGTNTQGSFF